MFDDAYLTLLSDDPSIAGKSICDEFLSYCQNISYPGRQLDRQEHDNFLKAFALLQAYCNSQSIELDYPFLSNDITENHRIIYSFFENSRHVFDQKFSLATIEKYRSIFEKKFGKGFFYEFSDGDLKAIQSSINELRKLISKTLEIDDEHKARLLKKLEVLQSELHKRVSDLDRFWGLLVEGSIVLKKIGENAKPIVDRIEQIVNIVWRVQARAEELPSDSPLELPGGDNENRCVEHE